MNLEIELNNPKLLDHVITLNKGIPRTEWIRRLPEDISITTFQDFLSLRDVFRLGCTNKSMLQWCYDILRKRTAFVARQNNFYSLNDRKVKSLLVRCPSLRTLDVNTPGKNPDWNQKYLFMRRRNIPVFHREEVTSNNENWNSRDSLMIEYIEAKNPDLLYFGDSYEQKVITENGFAEIASRCIDLVRLNISGCGSINNDNFKLIANGCKRLKYLNVASCRKLGDAGISALKNCPNLSELFVSRCRQITDTGIINVTASCGYTLKVLDISSCMRITDKSLRAMAENCARIRFLNLSSCHSITTAGVTRLVESCTELENLNVSGCPEVSGISVGNDRCNRQGTFNLQNLNLSWCLAVNDISLKIIAERCKNLQKLNLVLCKNLSSQAIQVFLDNRSDVKLLL